MLIELKWLEANRTKNFRTEIYRSNQAFDNIVDATLLTTVEPGIFTYLDTDVVQGLQYYYRFRLVNGNTYSPVSKLFVFDANPYTGPGPSRTQFGDETFGYYGTFPSDSSVVPSLNFIRNLMGMSALSSEWDVYPHKFAIGGSVRGTYAFPLAIGSEMPRHATLMNVLLSGQAIKFNMGLHEWAIILPSAAHANDTEHEIEHFPGELRSMLGVMTELYARVEDADTGNTTGDRLSPSNGQVSFYEPLATRFPATTIKWIISCDWTDDTAIAINWTQSDGPPPARPKELHIEEVDYSVADNWNQTLIWPVLIYTGLTGPI